MYSYLATQLRVAPSQVSSKAICANASPTTSPKPVAWISGSRVQKVNSFIYIKAAQTTWIRPFVHLARLQSVEVFAMHCFKCHLLQRRQKTLPRNSMSLDKTRISPKAPIAWTAGNIDTGVSTTNT